MCLVKYLVTSFKSGELGNDNIVRCYIWNLVKLLFWNVMKIVLISKSSSVQQNKTRPNFKTVRFHVWIIFFYMILLNMIFDSIYSFCLSFYFTGESSRIFIMMSNLIQTKLTKCKWKHNIVI